MVHNSEGTRLHITAQRPVKVPNVNVHPRVLMDSMEAEVRRWGKRTLKEEMGRSEVRSTPTWRYCSITIIHEDDVEGLGEFL